MCNDHVWKLGRYKYVMLLKDAAEGVYFAGRRCCEFQKRLTPEVQTQLITVVSNLTTPTQTVAYYLLHRQCQTTNTHHRNLFLATALLEGRPAPAFAHVLICCTSPGHSNSTASPWVPFAETPLHPFSSSEFEVCCQVVGYHNCWSYFLPCRSSPPSLPILYYAMEEFGHCICSNPLRQSHLNSGPRSRAFQLS